MWPFKKKNAKSSRCIHKYKDFPWYITCECDGACGISFSYCVKVTEPYVCVKCGDRINKVLSSYQRDTYCDAKDLVDALRKRFRDKIEHREVIEDMISDMQLVDREYLDVLESLGYGGDKRESS